MKIQSLAIGAAFCLSASQGADAAQVLTTRMSIPGGAIVSHGVPMTRSRLRYANLLMQHVKTLHPAPKAAGAFDYRLVPANIDYGSNTLQTRWVPAMGCLTLAPITGQAGPDPTYLFSDLSCMTGDPREYGKTAQYGLVMNKIGPSTGDAEPHVIFTPLNGDTHATFPNIAITELGYDMREGSHCTYTPAIIVVDTSGTQTWFSCNSSVVIPPYQNLVGGWVRRRFASNNPLPIVSMTLMMDEGTDDGPGFTGFAIFDNFDVNGTFRGRP